jgi:all-trans-retinol 13,14-reductase
MDGPAPRDMKTKIFSELEVFNNVEFIKIPEFYHFIYDGISFTMPHNPEEAASGLKAMFPEEISGIESYFTQLLNTRKKPAPGEIIIDISIGEFLDSIIKSNKLKLILLGNLGYFHDDPYSLSLGYYSVAQGSYFTSGASYIKGGSLCLSAYLAEFISKHEGSVLYNHLVTDLICESNTVTGVKYRKKGSKKGETFVALGKEIIANSAMPVVAEMLPPEHGSKLIKAIGNQKPGASLLTIYFGFKGMLSSIGNKHYSIFVFDKSVKGLNDILINNKGDFHKRNFTFVNYGQIDSGLAPEGKSVGALCCTDYLSDWENLSDLEYNLKKKAVTEIFIERLEALFPGFTNLIDYCETGTAATVKRFTMNPGGAVYGFEQLPGKSEINTMELPDNLYFASAWGKTGGGFSGAIYSGYLTAYKILRKG